MQSFVANVTGRAERVIVDGREFLKVPVSMIVPGVLAGSKGPLYYPQSRVAHNASEWDGYPVTLGHPSHPVNNSPMSASDDGVIDRVGMGVLKDSKFHNGKLRANAWLDGERTKQIAPKVYDDALSGRLIEVSTGLFTQEVERSGTHNGRSYTHEVVDYKPDHLAILTDQRGACSVQDGCGMNVHNAEHITVNNVLCPCGGTCRVCVNAASMPKGAVKPGKALKPRPAAASGSAEALARVSEYQSTVTPTAPTAKVVENDDEDDEDEMTDNDGCPCGGECEKCQTKNTSECPCQESGVTCNWCNQHGGDSCKVGGGEGKDKESNAKEAKSPKESQQSSTFHMSKTLAKEAAKAAEKAGGNKDAVKASQAASTATKFAEAKHAAAAMAHEQAGSLHKDKAVGALHHEAAHYHREAASKGGAPAEHLAHSYVAKASTDKANEQSKAAKTKDDHNLAKSLHYEASDHHDRAASVHREAGRMKLAERHAKLASEHAQVARGHKFQMTKNASVGDLALNEFLTFAADLAINHGVRNADQAGKPADGCEEDNAQPRCPIKQTFQPRGFKGKGNGAAHVAAKAGMADKAGSFVKGDFMVTDNCGGPGSGRPGPCPSHEYQGEDTQQFKKGDKIFATKRGEGEHWVSKDGPNGSGAMVHGDVLKELKTKTRTKTRNNSTLVDRDFSGLTNQGEPMDRPQMIQHLTTNCSFYKGKAGGVLNAMTNEQLEDLIVNAHVVAEARKLVPNGASLATNAMPAALQKAMSEKGEEEEEEEEEEEAPAKSKVPPQFVKNSQQTIDEWLSTTNAPKAVRQLVQNAAQQERNAKEQLIDVLTANVSDPSANAALRRAYFNLPVKTLKAQVDALPTQNAGDFGFEIEDAPSYEGASLSGHDRGVTHNRISGGNGEAIIEEPVLN